MTNPTPDRRNASAIWIVAIAVVVLVGVIAVVAARAGRADKVTSAERTAQTSDVTVVDPHDAASTTAGPRESEVLPPMPASGADPARGKTAPAIGGETLDGKPITIGPDGKAQVILFVAHWCPHCRREVPLIAAHLKDSPMPASVALRTVSTAVRPDGPNYPPKAWLAAEKWPVPVLADSAAGLAAQVYGLESFPYFVAVDAGGKVVQRASGELTTDQFDALVKAARTGKPVT